MMGFLPRKRGQSGEGADDLQIVKAPFPSGSTYQYSLFSKARDKKKTGPTAVKIKGKLCFPPV